MTGHAPPEAERPVILVVDDEAQVRGFLEELLGAMGYAAATAANGLSALAHLRAQPVDLVLLDLNMPGMDGREVLARMREDPALREVPVVVLSGTEETDAAVTCISGGAEDYLAKPFSTTLLQARIRSSLERRRLRAQERRYLERMERYSLDLEETVKARTRDLEEANRGLRLLDAAKGDFLALVAHELRTPVTGLLSASEFIESQELDEAGRREWEAVFRQSVRRLHRIVEDALLLTEIGVAADGFALGQVPLGPVLAGALEAAAPFAEARGVTFGPPPAGEATVLAHAGLLGKALLSLLECAVKFTPGGGRVDLESETVGGRFRLRIRAPGGSIPPEAAARFFEALGVAEPITPGGDLGLGPAVASRVLSVLGGGVALEPSPAGTVVFAVTLQRP